MSVNPYNRGYVSHVKQEELFDLKRAGSLERYRNPLTIILRLERRAIAQLISEGHEQPSTAAVISRIHELFIETNTGIRNHVNQQRTCTSTRSTHSASNGRRFISSTGRRGSYIGG